MHYLNFYFLLPLLLFFSLLSVCNWICTSKICISCEPIDFVFWSHYDYGFFSEFSPSIFALRRGGRSRIWMILKFKTLPLMDSVGKPCQRLCSLLIFPLLSLSSDVALLNMGRGREACTRMTINRRRNGNRHLEVSLLEQTVSPESLEAYCSQLYVIWVYPNKEFAWLYMKWRICPSVVAQGSLLSPLLQQNSQ